MLRICQLLLIISLMIISIGCSQGNPLAPVQPDTLDASLNALDRQTGEALSSNRTLWGLWQFTYDESSNELTPIPLREASAHFDVTPMLLPPACNDCLRTKVNSYHPPSHILDVDVTLRNPSPIAGYDVRGILFTNDYGHELRNPDDWTGLWDVSGGQTLNPFKAFAKPVYHRQFSGYSEYTENFRVYIPQPPHYDKIDFAVDASWPDNCKEPYSMENFTQEPLYDTGDGQAMITIDVLDWQDDVNKVTLVAPEITGEGFTQLYNISGDTWGIYVKNNAGAPAGIYEARFIAASEGSGSVSLHDFVTLMITETPPTGWARTWGGSEYDFGSGVAVDGSGNVIATGYFQDVVDFDPGPGVEEHTSNGDYDIYLVKFDEDGFFLWARTWGSAADDRGNEVAVDLSGNIYVTGYFSSTVDFDPGGGTDEHITNGFWDIYLSKFDSDGVFQWARTWGGDSYESSTAIAVDSSGNPTVTGYFSNTVDFDPGPGSDEHTELGAGDVFLSHFNTDGDFQWAHVWGSLSLDSGYGIAADWYGNIYTTGYFGLTADFDPSGNTDEHTSNGVDDIFLSKFDSNGTYSWAYTWGGTGYDDGFGVAVDVLGDVFVVGNFDGTVDFDPGDGTAMHASNGFYDIFLSKFDYNGGFNWAVTWGGTNSDGCRAVAVEPFGNIIVTGWFQDTADFDPGTGIDVHTSNGNADIFVNKFDYNGVFTWARTFGGPLFDDNNSVAADFYGSVFIIGWFQDSVDFDPGAGTDWHVAENFDAYLLKLLPDGYW